MTTTRRLLTGAAALTGVFALTLQLVLTIRLGLAQGLGLVGSVWVYLDYFTILTNALATASLARIAADARGRLFVAPEDTTAIAACMLMVGLVYNLLLRQTWHPAGWARVADELLHVAMPLLYLATWWPSTEARAWRRSRLLAWLCYPLGYLAYALLRGAADGRYPYPFLDVTALGYPRVLGYSAAVALAFLLAGAVLAALAQRRARR